MVFGQVVHFCQILLFLENSVEVANKSHCKKTMLALEQTMDFLFLSHDIKCALFSCEGFISALHQVPLLMKGTWLLVVQLRPSVGLQLSQTRCAVIKDAVLTKKVWERTQKTGHFKTASNSF